MEDIFDLEIRILVLSNIDDISSFPIFVYVGIRTFKMTSQVDYSFFTFDNCWNINKVSNKTTLQVFFSVNSARFVRFPFCGPRKQKAKSHETNKMTNISKLPKK